MKIKTICLSGLLIATAACSNSSDGKKFDAGNLESYRNLQDLDIRLNNKFKTRGVLDTSDASQAKEMYNVGCEVEGKAGNTYNVDPSARVGDSQIMVQYSNSQSMHSVNTITMMIEKIEDKKITTSYKTLSAIIQEAGGEVIKKPIEYKSACAAVEEKSGEHTYMTPKCESLSEEITDLTPYLTEAGVRFQPKLGTELDCRIEISDKSEQSKPEVGSYSLASGATIKAFMTTRTMTGDVICNGKNIGKGSEVRVDIESNDIISQNIWYCGGTMVTYSTTIRVGDKVIESRRFEIQTARLR